MPKANDRQHGGNHYNNKAIQPWDFILANKIGFLEGTAIKYLTRWREKNGILDLQKAIHFIEKLIESETANRGSGETVIPDTASNDTPTKFEVDQRLVQKAREAIQCFEAYEIGSGSWRSSALTRLKQAIDAMFQELPVVVNIEANTQDLEQALGQTKRSIVNAGRIAPIDLCQSLERGRIVRDKVDPVVDVLHAEVMRLRGQLDTCKHTLGLANSSNEKLREELSRVGTEKLELGAKFDQLEHSQCQEIRDLKGQMEELNDMVNKKGREVDMATEAFNRTRDELKDQKSKNLELISQIHKLSTGKNELQKRLNEADSKIAELTDKLDEEKSEAIMANEALNGARQELKRREKSNLELRANCQRLTTRNNELLERLNETSSTVSKLVDVSTMDEVVRSVDKNEIANLRRRVDEKDLLIFQLNREVEQLRQQGIPGMGGFSKGCLPSAKYYKHKNKRENGTTIVIRRVEGFYSIWADGSWTGGYETDRMDVDVINGDLIHIELSEAYAIALENWINHNQ